MNSATRIALSLSVTCLVGGARADHFSGATISYECLGGNQYRVSLDLFLDCAGSPITPHTLSFSNNCGVSFTLANLNPISVTEVSPLCPSQLANSTCNGGTQPSFKKYRFQSTLFLSPCNKWTISWYTCCRNTTQNVQFAPGMYAEATLNNAGGLCDNSPVFNDVGIPYVCVNQPVSYSLGAVDPDGNQMSFSLISARYASPAPTPVTYQGGFTAAQPIPGITINPITGQINFFPTVTGYYVVVVEARSFTSGGTLIGAVMRDLMFAVITCDGTPPQTTGLVSGTNGISFSAAQFIACEGSNFCLTMNFSDANPAQSITVSSNAATMLPGSTLSLSGTNPVTATLCWTATAASYPLGVTFQATDNACPIANSSSYAITAMDCAYLPVELLAFEVEAGAEGVMVIWRTGSEAGARAFVVERGREADAFTTVGEIPADGHEAGPHDYRFFDPEPLEGLSYYRLRMIDDDGSDELGPVAPTWRPICVAPIALLEASDRWVVHGTGPGASWRALRPDGAIMVAGIADERGAFALSGAAESGPVLLFVDGASGPSRLMLPPAWMAEPGMQVRARR